MKRKLIRAICIMLIVVLAVGIVTDWIVFLGFQRSFQYLYNFMAMCAIVALLILALDNKLYEL